MSSRSRLRATIRSDQHFLQWFILSELQACTSMTHYLDKKTELYDYVRHEFIERKAIYYAVTLLEEARRHKESGLVFFSDEITRAPTTPRPKQSPIFKVLTNENWSDGDDLKI